MRQICTNQAKKGPHILLFSDSPPQQASENSRTIAIIGKPPPTTMVEWVLRSLMS
jgi:hypothetical protein